MKKLILFYILFLASQCYAHKYYITIANLEYNSKENRIDVSLKMIAHDFEKVLNRKFDTEIHIEEIEDDSEVDQYCQAYLEQNFVLKSEGKQAKLRYLGKEINTREDLFFYFSFVNVSNPRAIKLVSNLLFSISDEQQNIVHYKYKDQTKSLTLVPSQNTGEIIF